MGNAFRSGSNGGVGLKHGMLGAVKTQSYVVIGIFRSLFGARGDPRCLVPVCFLQVFFVESKTIITNGKLILLGVSACPRNNHHEW